VQRSFERLSSGLRITKASDDVAGLAIADTLRVNSKLYGQAIRNVNDGASLINVIDGAVEQQVNIVTRLKELAEQSSNGTLTSAQRTTLNAEYRSLIKEYARIPQSTAFNGLSPLYGSRGSNSSSQILLQAGISGDALSQLGISTVDTANLSGTVRLYYGGSEIQDEATDFISNGPYTQEQILARYQNVIYGTSRSNGREQIMILYGIDNSLFPQGGLAFSTFEKDPANGLYTAIDPGFEIPVDPADPR